MLGALLRKVLCQELRREEKEEVMEIWGNMEANQLFQVGRGELKELKKQI